VNPILHKLITKMRLSLDFPVRQRPNGKDKRRASRNRAKAMKEAADV
jgi:hypothetical protein